MVCIYKFGLYRMTELSKLNVVACMHSKFRASFRENCQEGVNVNCKRFFCREGITSLVARPHIVFLALCCVLYANYTHGIGTHTQEIYKFKTSKITSL